MSPKGACLAPGKRGSLHTYLSVVNTSVAGIMPTSFPRHSGQASSMAASPVGRGEARMRMFLLRWTLKLGARFTLGYACFAFSPVANSNQTLINKCEGDPLESGLKSP